MLLFIGKGFSLMLGWVGSFAYLLAYLLLSLNKLKAGIYAKIIKKSASYYDTASFTIKVLLFVVGKTVLM